MPLNGPPRLGIRMFELSPIGTSNAVVWAEIDGRGSFRIRLDIDWFAPITQDLDFLDPKAAKSASL